MIMEKTVVAINESGIEPMFLAYGLGHRLGDVVVPQYYEIQPLIAKREGFEDFYFDSELAEILRPVIFNNDFESYLKANLDNYDSVREEMIDYLRDFEVTSVDGGVKRFKEPDIEINVGSIVNYRPESGYYTYPNTQSNFLKLLPRMYDELGTEIFFDVEDVMELSARAKEIEESYRIVFIPEINSLSYTLFVDKLNVDKLKNEVRTPHLKSFEYNSQSISKSVYVMASGHGTRAEYIIKAAEGIGIDVYSPAENVSIPGKKAPPSLIYNPNVVAVIARIGWGTAWKALQAGKPIITPKFKEGDHPEAFHNNKTLKALDFGVVFDEEITEGILKKVLSKKNSIKKLNRMLIDEFGMLDGLRYVQGKIKQDLIDRPLS